MSLNGQLELSLYEEKRFGFLSFSVNDGTRWDDQLTARITNDEDKKKYENWKCDVTIAKSCVTCGRGCEVKELRQVTLTSEASSSTFSHIPIPVHNARGRKTHCGHRDIKILLLVFIQEPKCHSEPKLIRFTDETEAKKLNANLKIRFEDSDEPLSIGDFKVKDAEEIKLGLNREDFLSFLECLYLPLAPITSRNFKTVVMIADIYDCPYLLQNCKKFAEEEVKTVSTVEECKGLIEIAEHLAWEEIMAAAVRVNFIANLLDWEWMMARKKTTVNLLFMRMKNLLSNVIHGQLLYQRPTERSYTSMFVPTTTRFTDEAESKKLKATCKIRFDDSDEPVFVNHELLAVYCNVFRAMFDENFKEKEIKLDVKREDFLYFLDCLYFPTAEVASNNFKVVLMMAQRFDCPQLFDKCMKFAEKEASKARTIEEFKDYIEVAEYLNRSILLIIKNMEWQGVVIFMELLKDEWIDERKPSTQQVLYEGLKNFVIARMK